MRKKDAFHDHPPPRVCVCGIHVGACEDVLSGPASIPQAWSHSWFVEIYI